MPAFAVDDNSPCVKCQIRIKGDNIDEMCKPCEYEKQIRYGKIANMGKRTKTIEELDRELE